MIDRHQIEQAAALVHSVMAPTPHLCWPLLAERAGCELWVKHENHTPIGAFKVRGGLTYMDDLKRRAPETPGVIAATRGNHGQSVGFAAKRTGIPAVIVVPVGNSREKNAAMRALGVELVEHGDDFQEAYEFSQRLAADRGLHMLRSFHPMLVAGVATYGYEFLSARPDLEVVYVPIGLGSGICGMIAARDALGLKTEIVGVVTEGAAAYKLSFEQGKPVSTNSADTMADGLACRVPDPGALEMILKGAARIVAVSDAEIKAAMRHYYTDTHNLAEGSGAAGLAAILKERESLRGRRIGTVLSGGNIDLDLYRSVLNEA
ncbi:threonine dehydratase [Oceanibaculum pacificum]|uniref:Tryptophan synthase beta chain-like PALP domain-containing protein n=1 Tax=Oceanibaculum pacificum TaxID=580166 RepID=A0A154VZ13_9PROT|nr:threonine dehydratase [Oceanibaculum pacificum]KZD06443.1 hypothetical protein AUP43_10650 [Oceanibaculum pacificum]